MIPGDGMFLQKVASFLRMEPKLSSHEVGLAILVARLEGKDLSSCRYRTGHVRSPFWNWP